MRTWKLSSWLLDFTKLWALPKIGLAIGVYQVASIFFLLPTDTELGELSVSRLNSLYDLSKAQWFQCTLYTTVIAFFAVYFWRMRADGIRPISLRKLKILEWLTKSGCLFLIGCLVVPLVVALACFSNLSARGFASPEAIYTSVAAGILVLLSVAFELLNGQENEPFEALTLVVSAPEDVSANLFNSHVCVRAEDVLSCTPHYLEYGTGVEARYGHAAVHVGFDRKAAQWSHDDLQHLGLFVENLVYEWRNRSFKVTLSGTPALVKRLLETSPTKLGWVQSMPASHPD